MSRLLGHPQLPPRRSLNDTQSRKEWEQSPEIVNLSVKAIAHLLEHYHELFQEHKTLINEQSLKYTTSNLG